VRYTFRNYIIFFTPENGTLITYFTNLYIKTLNETILKFLLLFFITLKLFAFTNEFYIFDEKSMLPIQGALISDQNCSAVSDKNGHVQITTDNKTVFVKAYGYKQKAIKTETKTVLLESFSPKALYVSF